MAKDPGTNFDVELFKKRVRLADSEQADGAVAFTQAAKQCKERTPPMLFYEAVARHMSPPRPSMDQVKEENARLEKENAGMRADNARLKQEIQELRTKQKGDEGMDEEWDFNQLVERVYGSPEGRIVAFFALLAVRFGVYLRWETDVRPALFWVLNVTVLIPMGMIFLDWISLQFRRGGPFIFILRFAFVVGGLLWSYSHLFGWMPWDDHIPVAHLTSRFAQSPKWAFAILAGTTLVVCSKAAWGICVAFHAFVLPLKPIKVVREMF